MTKHPSDDHLDPRSIYPQCGTYGGVAKHNREGTPICQPCRDAETVYRTEWRQSEAGKRSVARTRRARQVALDELARCHPAHYRRLYAAAKKAADK